MTTADWIKARRELLDDATDGPWATTADGSDTLSAGFNPDGYLCLYAGFGWDDDAALIADARTSLPLALDAIEAVQRLHARDHSIASRIRGICPSCAAWSAIETALAGAS